MPSFAYTARDPSGRGFSGVIEAENLDEGLSVLQARALVVTSLAPLQEGKTATRRRRTFHGGVSTNDRSMLCRQLAILLEAGVPLVRSLQIMSQQIESRPLWEAMERVRMDVEVGLTLHEAMAKYPRIFSRMWTSLVEVGESSGHLAEAFGHLAKHLERAAALQSKAISAMTYPAVLMIGMVVVMIVFLRFVIPQFSSMYANFGAQLPAITRATLAASQALQNHGLMLLISAVALGILLRLWLRTAVGQRTMDMILLRLPVFNILFHQLNLAQFVRGLGTLLQSGVPILYALEILEQSCSSPTYQRALRELKERVKGGKPLSEPMQWNPLFPPLVVSMANVGEEIGELPKMLDRLANFYDDRIQAFVERLSSILEPIAIAAMGCLVGLMVASLFMPMFGMANAMTSQ